MSRICRTFPHIGFSSIIITIIIIVIIIITITITIIIIIMTIIIIILEWLRRRLIHGYVVSLRHRAEDLG